MSNTKSTLIGQLSYTARLFMRLRHQKHRANSPLADTTRGQGRVLALLNLKPEMSLKELKYLLGVRNQSISELVAKLEKAGYVEKIPSDTDKRVMNVKLTEEGKKVAEAPREKNQDFAAIFDCLSEEEQKNLSEYLDRIIAELEKETDSEDGPMGEWPEEMNDRLREFSKRFPGYGMAGDLEGFMGVFSRTGAPGAPHGRCRGNGFGPSF